MMTEQGASARNKTISVSDSMELLQLHQNSENKDLSVNSRRTENAPELYNVSVQSIDSVSDDQNDFIGNEIDKVPLSESPKDSTEDIPRPSTSSVMGLNIPATTVTEFLTCTDDEGRPPRLKNNSPLTVFSFHAAVRQHMSVDHIEEIRKQLNTRETPIILPDALKFAIMYNHNTYSEFLLKYHLDEALVPSVCCPLLLLSVRLDRPHITEQLCYYSRSNIKYPQYINARGCSSMECKRTALHIAADMSSITIIRILIRYGANTKVKDKYNRTSLDQILHKLPSSHLSFNTVRCAWELLRCEYALQPLAYEGWMRLVKREKTWWARLQSEWQTLTPGPFTLMQQCRHCIRNKIGYPKLPQEIRNLGLPHTLQMYLLMEN